MSFDRSIWLHDLDGTFLNYCSTKDNLSFDGMIHQYVDGDCIAVVEVATWQGPERTVCMVKDGNVKHRLRIGHYDSDCATFDELAKKHWLAYSWLLELPIWDSEEKRLYAIVGKSKY